MKKNEGKKAKRKIAPPRALRRLPDELVAAAGALLARGEIDEAAGMCERALEAHADHATALRVLGIAEHQRGRSEAALELFARAVEQAPEDAGIHNDRGNVLRLLGRLEEAEAAYREAVSLQHDDAVALTNLASVLSAQGQFEEADRLLREALAFEPDLVGAHRALGEVLVDRGSPSEALRHFGEALRLAPDAGNSYRQFGATLYTLGRVSEAAETYRKWIAKEPDSGEAAHLLAGCTGGAVPARASDEYVRSAFDRFAASFDASLAQLEYRAPALVEQAVRGALGEPQASLATLDAGCGTGLCGPLIRPFARTLVGVDLSGKMLERARARGLYDELVEAELTAFLRAHERAYELVVSADTLIYFGALEAVATAAARALRPGGHLVFTVEQLEEADAPDGYRLNPHGRYSHTQPYVRRVVVEAGLVLLDITGVELRLEVGAWVKGWLVTARV